MIARNRMVETMLPAGHRPGGGFAVRSLRAEILILTARINFNP
jgi:hypothetical protein